MKKFKAFTLAEVLITLSIIGVVAAITMPILMQKYQKMVLVNQLKREYSVVSQAIHKMMADDGTTSYFETVFYQEFFDKLGDSTKVNSLDGIVKKYFKVISSEYALDSTGSFEDIRVQLNYGNVGGYTVYLNDGSIIRFGSQGTIVFMDINGNKGPNKFGRDAFVFNIDDRGQLIPVDAFASCSCSEYGMEYNEAMGYETETCLNSICPGVIGAGRIIKDGWKMNY